MSNPQIISSVSTEGKLVSIIVPTYREAENLQILIPKIREVMAKADIDYEIVVIDDNSGDGTEELVSQLVQQDQPIRLITRIGERGLSSAVIRGFLEARGAFMVCMDADMSHPPDAIPRLLECFNNPDVEFAIGSRYVPGGTTEEGWGLFRWLNSRVATLLAWPFTRVKDPMSGFFAFPRDVFTRAAALNPIGYKIGLEMIVKGRCQRIVEIPIHFADRKFGQSKLNLKEQINYLKHLKRLGDFKYGSFSRFSQFCFVGSTGMVIDFVI